MITRSRRNCHNENTAINQEPITEVDNIITVPEDGKIYCFDVQDVRYILGNRTNPYTRREIPEYHLDRLRSWERHQSPEEVQRLSPYEQARAGLINKLTSLDPYFPIGKIFPEEENLSYQFNVIIQYLSLKGIGFRTFTDRIGRMTDGSSKEEVKLYLLDVIDRMITEVTDVYILEQATNMADEAETEFRMTLTILSLYYTEKYGKEETEIRIGDLYDRYVNIDKNMRDLKISSMIYIEPQTNEDVALMVTSITRVREDDY